MELHISRVYRSGDYAFVTASGSFGPPDWRVGHTVAVPIHIVGTVPAIGDPITIEYVPKGVNAMSPDPDPVPEGDDTPDPDDD